MGKKKQGAAMEEENLKQVQFAQEAMLEQAMHADLLIEAQNETIPAHQSVLATISPVFRALFCEESVSKTPLTIKLEGIGSTKAVKAFLHLIYTGSLDPNSISWENGLEILVACHGYKLPVCMRQSAGLVLTSLITKESCLSVLEYAAIHDEDLFHKCKRFINKNFADIVQLEQFETLATKNPVLVLDLVRRRMRTRRTFQCFLGIFHRRMSF